jgi:hypothetical protein
LLGYIEWINQLIVCQVGMKTVEKNEANKRVKKTRERVGK